MESLIYNGHFFTAGGIEIYFEGYAHERVCKGKRRRVEMHFKKQDYEGLALFPRDKRFHDECLARFESLARFSPEKIKFHKIHGKFV